MHRIIVATFLVFLTAAPGAASPRSARWQRYLNRDFVTFDWNCAAASLLDPRVRIKVRRSIPLEDRGGPVTYGDRAVRVSLRSARPAVIFVPTVCGATGNCGWALYETGTHRFLGKLGGQFIYVRTAVDQWPMLIGYTREGGCDGVLSRYVYLRGQYRWVNDDLLVSRCDPAYVPLPGRLPQARTLCANYGS